MVNESCFFTVCKTFKSFFHIYGVQDKYNFSHFNWLRLIDLSGRTEGSWGKMEGNTCLNVLKSFTNKIFFLILQPNVSFHENGLVRLGQRAKLLRTPWDGSYRWLSLQILRLPVGPSWRCRATESTECLHSSRLASPRLSLASPTNFVQQSEAHQQYFG